jgi:hypothetical protein
MRVHELTVAERHVLRRGLKAADGFTVRRCQVLLASAERQCAIIGIKERLDRPETESLSGAAGKRRAGWSEWNQWGAAERPQPSTSQFVSIRPHP